jgi:hypothetical protein
MADDPGPLRAILDQLGKLIDLARRVPLEERTRLAYTTHLFKSAYQAVAWSRQAAHVANESEASAARQQTPSSDPSSPAIMGLASFPP